MKKLLSTALFLVIGFASVTAAAQARKNILDGQPEVRRRVLFLPQRFEITPEIGMTYLQDFKHNLLVGIRAEYHIIEALSVGVFFDYAVYSWHTQLTNEIESTLPVELNPNTTVDPSPSKRVMHILAGVGFAMFKPGSIHDDHRDPEGQGQSQLYIYYEDDYENGGFKVGPMWGFGLRFWVLKYLALAFTMRTIHIQRNSAGFDKTGDTRPGYEDVIVVSKKDESWEMLMSFTIGVSFFFPMNAPRSK